MNFAAMAAPIRIRKWSKRWAGPSAKHPLKEAPLAFHANQVTRQQRRAELRRQGMEWVSLRYGGELRAKRRELGFARARNVRKMIQMQAKIEAQTGEAQ